MQRWNGWGDITEHVDLPVQARNLLQALIGDGEPQTDYPLEKFIRRIPESRLPYHPLISIDPKDRLDHSHGQSLPDWVGMRAGTLQRFPDGVALPQTTADVAALLDFSEKHDVVVIPFGGGTSVVGHLQVPEENRPVLSLSLKNLNGLTEFYPSSLLRPGAYRRG